MVKQLPQPALFWIIFPCLNNKHKIQHCVNSKQYRDEVIWQEVIEKVI